MITFKRFPFGLFRHPVKLVHPVTLISGCLYHVPSLRQCRVARPSIHVQKRNQTAALSYKNEYIKVFNTIAMKNIADHKPENLFKALKLRFIRRNLQDIYLKKNQPCEHGMKSKTRKISTEISTYIST